MKLILKITCILLLICSCSQLDDNNYSDNKRVSLICDTTWMGESIKLENGDMNTCLYDFSRNGTYVCTIVTFNGTEYNISKQNGRWTFYDKNFNVIFWGGNSFWDIIKLTSQEFIVYDRIGEYGKEDMTRSKYALSPITPEYIKLLGK